MRTVIRPLKISDAKISYKWRNNPEIWRNTGRKPDRYITYNDELKWIKDVLARDDARRFAIVSDGHYVGNIQLTNINKNEASYHIFIGEREFWGHGIAYEATQLIISYAFQKFELDSVKLKVRLENEKGIKLYKKSGFHEISRDEEFITMIIERSD